MNVDGGLHELLSDPRHHERCRAGPGDWRTGAGHSSGQKEIACPRPLALDTSVQAVIFAQLPTSAQSLSLVKDKKSADQYHLTITETEEGPVPLRCEDAPRERFPPKNS